MAGLCEGGNEPPGSLKGISYPSPPSSRRILMLVGEPVSTNETGGCTGRVTHAREIPVEVPDKEAAYQNTN
ncbi:hypothetical protein ANN_26784 [Periplaneta americana]|uniref:Uncharacterized protein n=1 Tax=Periplaneta americana TaxID=6978 RepID=A0ABQ8RZ82_PERAM|nr:hypothetical protein ANN_26784 [Periplaneta americana]